MITYCDVLDQLATAEIDLIESRRDSLPVWVGEPLGNACVVVDIDLDAVGTQHAREVMALDLLLILRPELCADYDLPSK